MDDKIVYATDSDRRKCAHDLLLFGSCITKTDKDGRLEHVPLNDFRVGTIERFSDGTQVQG